MITIRGVDYETPQAAAEAHGLTVGAIYNARRRGLLGTVGLGRLGCVEEPFEIEIRGVRHPSQHAAAKALGVPQSAVAKALAKGTLDGVGLGRNHNRKKRCWLGGREFESIAALAREIDLTPRMLASRIRLARNGRRTQIVVPQGIITWKETS